MVEIDLRNYPWALGFPTGENQVSRELYSLLTIFAASEVLAQRQQSDDGGCVYSWSVRSFEFPEIARILISVAATLRNYWDAAQPIVEAQLSLIQNSCVGQLVEGLSHPVTSRDLFIRESLNKILHGHTINMDRSQGPSIFSGHLNPFVHLYGERNGQPWKATLDIYRWAEVVHSLV